MLRSSNFIKSLFILLFIATTTCLSAQVEQSAELKVSIQDLITFTLNDANPTLVFDEASDFINGVSYTANNAGTITASAPFSVTVKAEKNHLRDSAGNKIKVKSILLLTSGTNLGTVNKIEIGPSKKEIISSASAGILKSINLTYSTVGNDDEFIGKPAGDYTVDLVFITTLD